MSTMTEPYFIFSTISLVINVGAGAPLSCAVVIMTSAFTASSNIFSCCFCLYSAVCSTAYPPAALSSVAPSTSINFAPRLSTSSLAAARVSNACTTEPSLLAVATACNPATPAPITNTLAGGMLPAAVVNIGKYFGRRLAARITALYPAIDAIEESTSIA